jgi:hypothetical protein
MPSQFNQDAILDQIFQRIGTTNKFCVEFGHDSDGYGSSNTGNLIQNKGWDGLLMDGSHENPEINLHKEFITSENIVTLFDKYNVPDEPDYVSIDLDSTDLWVFRSIIKSKYKPRVITVEYNPRFPINSQMTIPDDPSFQWNGKDHLYGASLAALFMVGLEFGYTLVYTELPCDAFFIRSDLNSFAPELHSFASKTNTLIHDDIPHDKIEYLVDYKQWRRNNS